MTIFFQKETNFIYGIYYLQIEQDENLKYSEYWNVLWSDIIE
jgi:hypothetical protein